MKEKVFFRGTLISYLLLIVSFFAGIILQTGCNNSGAQPAHAGQKTSTNWTSVDITFMPNTNEEWREKSIRAIEKMLIKSVTPFTKQYANFYPSITITKMPFWDSLKYRISVLNTYRSKTGAGEPKLLSTAISTPCPPCPGYCPQCDSTNKWVSSTYNIAKMVFEQPK